MMPYSGRGRLPKVDNLGEELKLRLPCSTIGGLSTVSEKTLAKFPNLRKNLKSNESMYQISKHRKTFQLVLAVFEMP